MSSQFDLIIDEDDPHVEGGARDDRPTDPAVVARAAGRVVKEPTIKEPPARNRKKRRRRIRGPPVDAFPIPVFCDRHGISVASYYRLPLEQRPREMTIRGRKAISTESAADWRRQREAQTIAKQKKEG